MRHESGNSGVNVFDDMGIYWAEIADQNQTDRQIQFLKNMLKADVLILDVACGTGRHLIPLSKEGFGVIGLDVSQKLLRIAKSRWREAQVVQADMLFLPFKAGAFSAAVSMDTSFGYLPSEEDDLQSLTEVHEALGKNGFLVVDVFNPECLINQCKSGKQPKWKEYLSFFLLQKRSVDVKSEILHDSWVVYDKVDGQTRVFEHNARLYRLQQLQGFFEKAGFRVIVAYGDYDQQSFSPSSGRLILIASSE